MLARQIAIGFGIAVIFPLLVYYGVSTFHPAPKWQDFNPILPSLSANATTAEITTTLLPRVIVIRPLSVKAKRIASAGRSGFRCRAERQAFIDAGNQCSRILVIVATPLGIATILIGAYLTSHAIGTGLILGGIGAIAIGYWSYWNHLEDWMRFASLLAGFAILLFVGYRMVATRPRSSPV